MRISAVKQVLEMRISTHSKGLRRNTVKTFWEYEKDVLDWWSKLY